MYEIDNLKVYKGEDIQITSKIKVLQPTIGEIADFGEQEYFSAVRNLTAVGADMKWTLWEMGIDYTEISDYDLFVNVLYSGFANKQKIYRIITDKNREQALNELKLTEEELENFKKNSTELILNINLADFEIMKSRKSDGLVLFNREEDIIIDKLVYLKIVEAVRKIHLLKRNNEIPGNKTTKMDLIEDDKYDIMARKNKPYESVLLPLVSAISSKFGLFDGSVWNMKINVLLDSIRRIHRIQDANYLLQGVYSGFASLKKIDRRRLDWTGNLYE